MSIENAFQQLANIGETLQEFIKVAIFDETGECVGWQYGRPDQLGLLADDPYTRIPWRPEWDLIPAVPYGPGGMFFKLGVPHLSELQNE